MDARVVWAIGQGIILFAGLLGIAFASGYWAILIALGSSAYLLVLASHDTDNAPRVVVMSHLTALIAGWGTYTILAQGIAPTGVEPMSESVFRIVGSALSAFVITTAIFYALESQHQMAYVTALTAAIGSFPTIQAIAVTGVAILFVAGIQAIRREVGPEVEIATDATAGRLSET